MFKTADDIQAFTDTLIHLAEKMYSEVLDTFKKK